MYQIYLIMCIKFILLYLIIISNYNIYIYIYIVKWVIICFENVVQVIVILNILIVSVIEHINSFSDDGNDYIDYYVDTRGHIYDMNVNVLKTTPGPPILFK